MPSRLPAQKTKLPNKATLLVEENHSLPIVSFCAYFQGGTRLEEESNNGITYFMQKVLPKGSEKFTAQELAFKTEAIGSNLVFFTEKDHFGCHTSVLSKHFDEALELFFEAIFHPTFLLEEVEKEREVILAEIKESRDEIYSHCLELCDRSLFTQHPYRLATRGELESVKSLHRNDLANWHQQWMVPNNLVFAVVGDISAERMMEKAAVFLERLPKVKFKPVLTPSENGHGEREVSVELEKRQLAISLGFVAPPAVSDDRFPFEVLNGLLSGMGSRLFIELRDKKGLAYSVGSRYDALLDFGILKTYMGTAAEQEQAAKEGLLEELMRLRTETPGEEELQRTKRHLIGLYEISRQKSYVGAMRYARYEMLGLGWRVANLYPKKIEAVQSSAVREVAERYLNRENFSCAVVRPAKRQPAEPISRS